MVKAGRFSFEVFYLGSIVKKIGMCEKNLGKVS
jgi:hypothetical protein